LVAAPAVPANNAVTAKAVARRTTPRPAETAVIVARESPNPNMISALSVPRRAAQMLTTGFDRNCTIIGDDCGLECTVGCELLFSGLAAKAWRNPATAPISAPLSGEE
jgi:hypothetical protein